MKVSKKAIAMWGTGYLLNPIGIAVLIFWFISGNLYLYLAPQKNLSNVLVNTVALSKWVFLGLSAVLVFLLLSAFSKAFYRFKSVDYELEDAAFKIMRGFYKKEELYIPYKNIQNIEITMSAGERFWGLATVLIHTSAAGNTNNPDLAEGFVDGIKYKSAVILKDELLKRIGN